MSDLSFVAGEFLRLASTAREAAEAVRSARPEGGASAFASAMPGTNLSSKMQGVEEKFADQATKTGMSLDEHAESLLAAERGFIAPRKRMASSLAPSFKATAKVQVLVLVRVPRLVRPCPATAMARVWPAHKLGRLMTW